MTIREAIKELREKYGYHGNVQAIGIGGEKSDTIHLYLIKPQEGLPAEHQGFKVISRVTGGFSIG